MDIKQAMTWLSTRYDPLAVFLYGSICSGDTDAYSDLDCVLIVRGKERNHETSMVGDTRLDCLVLTEEDARSVEPEVLSGLYHSVLLKDTDGIGKKLKERIVKGIDAAAQVDGEEKQQIRRMLRHRLDRMSLKDDLGLYQAAALVWESLADYFLLRDRFYFGEKKSIAWLSEHDARGARLFHEAVLVRSNRTIGDWIRYVIDDGKETV